MSSPNVLIHGHDGTTQRPALCDSDGRLQVDSTGAPSASSSDAPTTSASTAYAASQVVKAAAGTLYKLSGYNSGGAQFVQIHNTASLPADAAVPVVVVAVAAASNFNFDLSAYGQHFTTGITVCNSSTGPTKTIGAADVWFNALYK